MSTRWILLSLFASYTFADGVGLTEHKFKGCPLNTSCTKELGLLAQKMKNTKSAKSLERVRKKQGLLISVWLRPKVSDESVISWDSPCPSHKKDLAYQRALVPLKSLTKKSRESHPNIFFHYFFLQDKASYQKIFIPRGNYPIYIKNKNLYLVEHIDGSYYGLRLSSKGLLKVVAAPKIIQRSNYIDCPKNLKEIV